MSVPLGSCVPGFAGVTNARASPQAGFQKAALSGVRAFDFSFGNCGKRGLGYGFLHAGSFGLIFLQLQEISTTLKPLKL